MAILGPFDFRGGYVTGYDFPSLPAGHGYAMTMQNCRFRSGAVVLRWGWRTIATLSLESAYGLAYWTDTVNSKSVLVATTSSNKIYIGDVTGFLPGSSTLTLTDRTGAIATNSVGYNVFDSLNNILIGTVGSTGVSNSPFKITAWNANAAALGGSPPAAGCIKQCNNFLFLSRNLSSTTTQSRVYWSNVNDPETWTGTNVLDFNKNDGEPIMALGSIGTDLYIFKQTSIGRLSTVTITTSGAVTLGPLVTVIRGVGCCGPRALDNLPNGNIIFWGFNGHLYEFDGSSLIDRSRHSFPGPNVYDQWSYAPGSGSAGTSVMVDRGLAYMVNGLTAQVKVVRGANEVHIACLATIGTDVSPYELIYDFEQNIWQGTTFRSQSTINSASGFSYAVIPVPGTAFSQGVEFSDCLVVGDGATSIRSSGDPNTPYPSLPGSTEFAEVGTTINLMTPDGPFIPRSILFTTSETQASGSGKASLSLFKVLMDFDTPSSLASTQIYSATAGTQLATRIVANIPFKQDSVGTNVFPSYLGIRFQVQGQSQQTNTGGQQEILRIGPFWLSDEIIR